MEQPLFSNPSPLDGYRLGRQINRNPEHQVRTAHGPHGPAIVKFVPLFKNPFVRRMLISEQAGVDVQRDLYLRHLGRPIPKVYDAGIDDGCWFVAMERVYGVPLSECILAPCETLRVMIELARCLAQWQETGIAPPVILGDIKPSNLMRDGEGHLWIVDFGAAQTAPSGCAPDVIRSLAYCSPERLEHRVVSPATDRWALMVTFYELLVGCRPFDLEVGFTAQPPYVTGLEQAWYEVLAKGLALDPACRHASSRALLADLEALANTDSPTRVTT